MSIFFRFILELVMIVIVITVLRSVIGVVLKFLGGLSAKPAPKPAPGTTRPAVPAGGELKKDPVCGTFISTSGALQKTVRGEVYYFCSPECRDKFKG